LFLLRLLSGPAAFALTAAVPLGLSYEGRLALATFVCVIVWWMTQPMPWAVAAMLPFLVFPAAGVMNIAETMRLYGQPIFFWILGTVLMGYAIEKHGLAYRFALAFLALRGIGGRMHRLTFIYMLIVTAISMFVSDAATVAMTVPIGMSVVRHTWTMSGTARAATANFAAFITLGTFYASVAGGTATIMGVPHNAIAVAILEQVTGRQLGFFEWMIVGMPVCLALLVAFYALLWIVVPPEIRALPRGEAFLRAERAKLGPMRANEVRVLVVFAIMVALFTLPTLLEVALGSNHPVTAAAARALPVWVVPPAVLFLLFTIRSSEDGARARAGGALLSWRDAEQHGPWNTMFLVAGAVAMTDALTQFGVAETVGRMVSRLGIGATMLPYVAAAAAGIATNFISGTALFASIFVPAAQQIGFNPASMAILLGHVGVGLIFPWAGATSATAFAAGEVSIARMMWIGLAATVMLIVLVATIHLMMAPLV
jgi:solute carrier family 13 (sodium-dependent dicarboxylate transporter), member 2/3/5